MTVLDVKSCSTCDKKEVCKYTENRKELERLINDVVAPRSIEEAPFSISLSCGQHKHDVRERSFA